MKIIDIILTIILLVVIMGCGRKNQSTDLVIVDVEKSYPGMELTLQNFMDVEYIALETSDEFITQGRVMDVGKEIIIVKNRINDGNILIFDRVGEGLRKINRRGNGEGEYTQLTQIILDEKNNELLVIDYPLRKLLAYDLYGNFKRSFRFEGSYYQDIFNYDSDHLICHRRNYGDENAQPDYIIISKEDGSIAKEIKIPIKAMKTPVVKGVIDGEVVFQMPSFNEVIPYKGNFLLAEASSDTVYCYSQKGVLTPFIVRTPSIHYMDPQIFLLPYVITDRYYFLQIMKKTFDFDNWSGFPIIDLVYDKQKNSLFEATVYNGDFLTDKQVDLWSNFVNHEIIVSWQLLDPIRLVDSYEKGELREGRLKEIAAKLDKEDNPVIMLIKDKKK